MHMTTATPDILTEAHRLQSADHPWAAIRDQGWESFQTLGWPDKKTEAYKYTPLDALFKKSFHNDFVFYPTQWPQDAAPYFYSVTGHHLVFINGNFSLAQSSLAEDDAIQFTPFSEMDAAELGGRLGVLTEQTASVAVNTAFLAEGLHIEVKAASTALPVFIYHFRESSKGPTLSFPRLLINVAENAEIGFTEQTFDQGAHPHLSCPVTEIDVARYGRLRWNKIQLHGAKSHTIDNYFVRQADQSVTFLNTYSLSGGLIRNNPHVTIEGEYSEANLYGLYLLNGKSHVDNHTIVDHRQPNCNSNELYKGIIDDQATGVFNGKIFVRQAAQKTNAFQANNNVVLSDDAHLHTKPQLEIWADDVKCSHGCTSGQMDEEALFYLQARGISRNFAKAMLLKAFAAETLRHLEIEQVRELIESSIEERLS